VESLPYQSSVSSGCRSTLQLIAADADRIVFHFRLWTNDFQKSSSSHIRVFVVLQRYR